MQISSWCPSINININTSIIGSSTDSGIDSWIDREIDSEVARVKWGRLGLRRSFSRLHVVILSALLYGAILEATWNLSR